MGIAHAAVTRRPPILLDTMLPRTGGFTYDVGVLGVVRRSRAILCRAVPNVNVTIRNFLIDVRGAARHPHGEGKSTRAALRA